MEAGNGTKTIRWIIAVEDLAFVEIFIDPQFEVLFVLIASKSDSFSHLTCFLVDGVDVKIIVTVLSFVCGEESYFRFDCE